MERKNFNHYEEESKNQNEIDPNLPTIVILGG
jgi:hypothetical protein